MENWKEMLSDVDDDYLIGISNKGIVKRAYKDKEEVAAVIGEIGDEASVKVGEETVTVRFPLGESKCSCPSRSICRHVVQAILVLKESCCGGSGGASSQGAEGVSSGEGAVVQGAESANSGTGAAGQNAEAGTPGTGAAGQNAEAGTPGTGTATQGEKAGTPGAGAAGQNAEAGTPGTGAAGQNAEAGTPGTGTATQGEKAGTPGTGTAGQNAEAGTPGTGVSARNVEVGTPDASAGNQGKAAAEQNSAAQGEAASGAGVQSGKEVTQNRGNALQNGVNQGEAGGKKNAAKKVCKEIDEYPFARLQKVLGTRQMQILHNQLLSGIKPDIQYSSIVTVKLPEHGTVVKLLSPLDYSSCTCHKKELCVHKAAAILWCKLESGALKEEELGVGAAESPEFQMDKAGDAAGQMKVFLEELFCTGLSRTSPDVLDYLERLAIISHNAGLAKFEGYFRSLSDSYDRYFQRKAIFRTGDLMEQITRLYKRVGLLEKAVKTGDSGEVLKQAGEFRADYIPVGNLDLLGITMEHFQTQTGYEGETVYFLEEHKKQWYTYTNARPMFYDKGSNHRSMERSQAPWGLNIAIADMAKVRLHLTGAKCDARNRLSSTQETKGEIMSMQGLGRADIEEWYYEDFGKLFSERIDQPRKNWLYGPEEQQKGVDLVFIQPDSCVKAEFSQSGQQLFLPLYDRAGREVVIEMAYSKQEASSIRYLERISEKEPSCFLGKIYLRDGRIRMYPVTVFKKFTEL